MILQNSFFNNQSQASALGIRRPFKTLELPKQIRQLSFRYSDAAIADAQRNIACNHSRGQSDGAPCGVYLMALSIKFHSTAPTNPYRHDRALGRPRVPIVRSDLSCEARRFAAV